MATARGPLDANTEAEPPLMEITMLSSRRGVGLCW